MSESALTMQDAEDAGRDQFILLGLVRGHWDHRGPRTSSLPFVADELEQVNMGIAIITPIQKATEIIDGEELTEKRNKAEKA
jgi:hypothetical protein